MPKKRRVPNLPPSNVDWESIEVDFKRGTESICSIARRHGITDAAIHHKAKRLGWKRRPNVDTKPTAPNEIKLAKGIIEGKPLSIAAKEAGMGRTAAKARVDDPNSATNTYIRSAAEQVAEELGLTARQVVEADMRIAFQDPADYYNPDGTLRSVLELPERARMALKSHEVEVRGLVRDKDSKDLDISGAESALPVSVRNYRGEDRHKSLERLYYVVGLSPKNSDSQTSNQQPQILFQTVIQQLNIERGK